MVVAVPAATALVFVRAGIDGFTTAKATVVWWAALSCLAAGVAGVAGAVWVGGGRGPRWSRFATLAGVLAAVLVVSAALAPSPLRAVVGEAGRHSGVAMWIAALVLAVAARRVARLDGGRALIDVTVVGSIPVSGYALVQAAGLDPLEWTAVEGGPQVFATFGNADYLSAWLGMVVPLAVAVALDGTRRYGWRLVGLAAGLLGYGAALASGSLQGPIAGVVGAGVVVVWTSRRDRVDGDRRGVAPAGAGLLLVVVAIVAVAAVVATQPLRDARRSFETRQPIWTAAWRMATLEPVTGVGPGHFVDEWFMARPDSAVPLPDPEGEEPLAGTVAVLGRPVDDAHDVPLQVAATAGWPAALIWAALVLMAVVQAVVRPSHEERSKAGGLLGAVAATLIVWTVSVDAVPVTVTAWMLIGSLSGVASPVQERAPAPVRTQRPGRTLALVAVGVLLPLSAVPLAADLVAGAARDAERSGDVAVADRLWRRATRLAPWERRYPSLHSRALAQRGNFEEARLVQQVAARRAPRNRSTIVDLARITAASQGATAAVEPYRRVVEIDDRTPALQAEAAANALAADRPELAVPLLRDALARVPGQPLWVELLRRARRQESA